MICNNSILHYFVLSLFLCLSIGSVITASGCQVQLQETNIKVLHPGYDDRCPSKEEKERALNKIHQIANQTIASVTGLEHYTCNGTSGWRRVAFINMTDSSYNCPTGLTLSPFSKRTCAHPQSSGRCSSTIFSTGGMPYSRVYGRIMGYQYSATSGFEEAYSRGQGIDGNYVSGVSLTHGSAGRHQHIWTFAAGLAEITSLWRNEGCPCDKLANSYVPSFVGNDYFCESGVNIAWEYSPRYGTFFPDDVLWDGQNCTSTSTCCQFNSPPWFTKNLPTNTTDDIELRICAILGNENTPLEVIELYVQ